MLLITLYHTKLAQDSWKPVTPKPQIIKVEELSPELQKIADDIACENDWLKCKAK